MLREVGGRKAPASCLIMSQKPETRLMTKILKRLRAEGGWWFKTHGSVYQMAGLPDLVGCHLGHFIGLEIKTPGKEHETSPRQEHTMNRIRKAGGIAAVVSSESGALGVLALIETKENT